MLAAFALCVAPCLQDDPVELRGAWISPTDTSVLATRAAIASTMDLLYDNGFNAVFVPAWGAGLPLFQSPVCEGVAGFSIDPAHKDRDPFKELVFEAHRAGLEVFATFERGLCVDEKGTGRALLDKKPEWAACGPDKKHFAKDGALALAALDPGAQSFAIELVREMLLNYEVDGLCLDGSILAMPVETGYDAKTSALHRDERKIDAPPETTGKAWTEWRLSHLTEFVERFRAAMLDVDPNLLFVLSTRDGDARVLRDPRAWFEKGLFDVWMPRVEAGEADAHAKWLADAFASPLAGARPRFAAPALIPSTSLETAAFPPLVAAQRTAKLAGETWLEIPRLVADDGKLVEDMRQGPYYVVATLPWREGVEWRPRVESIAPKAGIGAWEWRTDADGLKVLEMQGGADGDASWTFRAPEAGSYELWTWISPEASLGRRMAFTHSAVQGLSTKVVDPSSKRFRGWVYIGRTALKRHEEREVMKLEVKEADATKVVVAGPLVALPSHRTRR